MSKLAHLRQFERSLQEYQLVPSPLASKNICMMVLALSISLAELLAGFGLISGFWLVPATMLAILLFSTFCVAMSINLLRGRRDLSCHCGGMLGSHLISWGLVGRNFVLLACLFILVLTPADQFTISSFMRSPSLLNQSFVSTVVPVAVLVGAVIAIITLYNAARVLWRS